MAIVKNTGTPETTTSPKKELVLDYGEPLNLDPLLRMLIIADTGAGKTSQIGLLAEYIKATEDKDTILFTADKGGFQPIRPYIDLGIIKPVIYDGQVDPWIWISHAIRGEVKVNGLWLRDSIDFGLAGYEGLTAFAELMMMNLAEHSAKNPNQAVGGESAWSFETKDGTEKLALASNTMSHYGLAQMRIMHEIWEADPGVPSIWTAILQRTSDPNGGGGLLAAQTVGKSQGHSLPRWFDYTFRLDARPSETGPVKHTLYLTTHLDKHSKGAKVVANARLPLAGADKVEVAAVIEPADIVKALMMIRKRNVAAKDSIQERIAMIRGKRKNA